ncbi:conserved exported protein of unknown function [Tepidanaerobacter acetatoxydans Re1]|uniref:RND related barrel-sandwich hybrid domain-containing protein n=1 Tax=Tepidanaerobacter acetatoxydans (strain DSM 21804 / JCM 16047 / Re1) TaxID=1209989 RepID=F4LVW3_TEPAE|nr:HlyD family efflux transporter periplasmic adaptor subunit [Tepidanaerobacter acetatoxydans]AEE91631.1 hypothetical protein TepRe1_1485 [Tepidanaerobacter acetatoxydans Re1]CDI40756.1 conserved exported protein of unknown function [Tepidanaerobacter acetatoxydans Re1]
MHQNSNKKVIYLKPKKSFFLRVRSILILFFIGIIIFAAYHFLHIKTYVVSKGTIDKGFFSDAVIIKNEKVLLSPTNGKLELLVDSGERVRVGAPVFRVTTDARKKEIYLQEITEIEDKIKSLKDSEDTSSISLNLINKSIEDITQKLKDATDISDSGKAKLLEDELTRLREEKQEKIDSNKANIDVLQEQLEKLKNVLNESDTVVYAPIAGIVSLNIDGFEDLLVADTLGELTYSQLQAVSDDSSDRDLSAIIKTNQAVVKIIDNFTWYLALKLEHQMEEGRSYYIKLLDGNDGNEKIKAKLINISEDGSIGFFLVNTGLDSLLDSRKIKVFVVTGTYTGNIIPSTGLFFNEGKEGVYIIEQGKKQFKPIEITARNENNIIINGLKPGDKILLKK